MTKKELGELIEQFGGVSLGIDSGVFPGWYMALFPDKESARAFALVLQLSGYGIFFLRKDQAYL